MKTTQNSEGSEETTQFLLKENVNELSDLVKQLFFPAVTQSQMCINKRSSIVTKSDSEITNYTRFFYVNGDIIISRDSLT